MGELKKIIYTIGHSNHDFVRFIELIKEHNINCIIDVRSMPQSKYVPQYNKDILLLSLSKLNILYMHFGKEFGARITNKELHDKTGKVDFLKVQKSESFLSGIKRLNDGLSKNYKMALMCAEADPLDCHRFSMVSYYLSRNGFQVNHILKNKQIETNEDVEIRLLNKFSDLLPKNDLFTPDIKIEDQLKKAYIYINNEIGFKEKEEVDRQPWI